MNLKKDDNVKVITGKDKGKTGKIVHVDSKLKVVTVEGINLRTKHQRPKKSNQKGQKVQLPTPLNPSKLVLLCPRCGKPTRVGYKFDETGKKFRTCKKCQGIF